MASCSRCGAAISNGAAFCSACGYPVLSTGAGPAATQKPAGAVISSNVAAALSYLLWIITGIFFLCVEPYRRDPFVRFHAFQAICFHVGITVLWVIRDNIMWMGYLSLGFLMVLLNFVGALISLGIIFYWIYLMYKAYNGERYLIPMIGEIASRLASKEN